MKVEDFKYCIVTDEKYKPMSYCDQYGNKQLCYCDNETWKDDVWPLKIVTVAQAKEQIKKSNQWRKKQGMSISKYLLMPVDFQSIKEAKG